MRFPGNSAPVIRRCSDADFDLLYLIINESAQAYRGVIPDDCMHEPYMTADELEAEIADGVEFWGAEAGGIMSGIMGIQYLDDVTLIRHAYVRTAAQNRGIGGVLIEHLKGLTEKPVLVGTWRAAVRAVGFYEKHGFRLLGESEHAAVLNMYWTIGKRQIETSVVLADSKWHGVG